MQECASMALVPLIMGGRAGKCGPISILPYRCLRYNRE